MKFFGFTQPFACEIVSFILMRNLQRTKQIIFKNYLFILISVSLVVLSSCNKKEQPPISHNDVWDCHSKKKWDSLEIKNNLIGSWDLEFMSCFWVSEIISYDDSHFLTNEFRSDNTLEVMENNEIIQNSNWRVVNSSPNLFTLEVEPVVAYLKGYVLFCDERVEFNYSYIDLCDHFFKRKQ